jgi:hypothetical protein
MLETRSLKQEEISLSRDGGKDFREPEYGKEEWKESIVILENSKCLQVKRDYNSIVLPRALKGSENQLCQCHLEVCRNAEFHAQPQTPLVRLYFNRSVSDFAER